MTDATIRCIRFLALALATISCCVASAKGPICVPTGNVQPASVARSATVARGSSHASFRPSTIAGQPDMPAHPDYQDVAPDPATWLSNEAQCPDSPCGGIDEICGMWLMPQVWAQADLLLWWAKGNRVPPLVTTSPDGTDRNDAGVLGVPGTSILQGGQRLDGNVRSGMRVTLGYWFDPCQSQGLEVTWIALGDGANSGNYYAQSRGVPLSPILARPFFNVTSGLQDSLLIAFPGDIEGDVQVLTSSEMQSVAILARRLSFAGPVARVDLLGGYRFIRFREGLTVTDELTSTDAGGVIPVGTQFDVFDSFATKNDFHGGEVGVSITFDQGCCWAADVLAKLALGGVQQTVVVDGRTAITSPIDAPVISEGGILALPTNIGKTHRDEFTVIPELNVNLRYYASDRLSFKFGYSLLWLTDVARTGDQIDFGLNPSQFAGGGGNLIGQPRPAPLFINTSMWVQGINLGVTWQY